MNKSDLEELAEVRIREARALLDARMPDGSYYLAGYAVECALKACIAGRTKQYDFPDKKFAHDCYTHQIDKLVKLADLEVLRASDANADPALATNWQLVKDWSERVRYERKSLADAQDLYDAVTEVKHGVLIWIKSHW